MSRYDALGAFLQQSGVESITLSFSELEHILQNPLPPSALKHREWWANGGHSQAKSWLAAGYRVNQVNQADRFVRFNKTEVPSAQRNAVSNPSSTIGKPVEPPTQTITTSFKKMHVCGYEFIYAQSLIPELENKNPVLYYPEKNYDNLKNLPLLYHGRGPFCRFSVNLPPVSGVYLWVLRQEIVYIGEAVDLRRRFNMGYGNISPRNCYLGGQSTNCKMNKVVLKAFQAGTPVDLFYLPTSEYKQVELQLLRSIRTKYNVKDN